MARQAPTYAAHIAQIRQQAVEETAGERGRLQGQLSRVQAEMQRLQSCNDADRQATKDLMEVEKIQVGCSALVPPCCCCYQHQCIQIVCWSGLGPSQVQAGVVKCFHAILCGVLPGADCSQRGMRSR